MPTYDYKCTECGHVFEEFQSMKADPLKDCPNCGKPALKRLMAGGAGMIFKGSGFYLTDYARKGGESKTGSDKKKTEGPAKEKKETPKSDTKPSGEAKKD